MNRVLFWVTLYVALIGGSFMAYHLVLPVRISMHVLAVVGLAAYFLRYGLPDSPFTIGALLMVAALGLSISTAMDKRMALENGWNWFVNLLVLLGLIHLMRRDYGPTLFKAHTIAGAVVATVAIVEFLFTHSRPVGIFGNISITGAYMAALIVPTYNAAHDTLQHEVGRRLKHYLLLVLLVVGVIVGDNRGSLLSAGVATLAYITLTWQKPVLLKLGLWLGAGGLLAAGLLFISLKPNHANGDPIRLDLWRAGSGMIQQYSFGVGPGLFAHEYLRVGTSGLNRFADAHNHYLTLGAELGAPGLAAGAVLILTALYSLIGLQLNRSQLAALAALIGIAVHMLFDSFPSDNWALLVSLYAAYVLYDARLNLHWRALRFFGTAAAVALTIWTIQILQFDRAQISYEVAVNTGRIYDAYDAVLLDPDMKLYQIELNRMAGNATPDLDADLALVLYGRMFR